MRITQHMYQISGSCYGTNSSTYVLDAGEYLVLFDAGYTEHQKDVMRRCLRRWQLDGKPVRHLFLTHAHMDHAGNAAAFRAAGARVYVGEADADALRSGGLVTLDKLFGLPFTCCEPDVLVREGDAWTFGEARVTAVALPGHTAGSTGYLVKTDGLTCFVTGDFVALGLASPDETSQTILLAAMIRPGFDEAAYGESLEKASHIDADILLPGHLITYEGDTKQIFRTAAEQYASQPHNIMDLTAE